jgi:Transglycosylase SLT domain
MRYCAPALLAVLATTIFAAPPARPAEGSDCAAAIATAERSGDIPAGLLAAIAHVESGRMDPASGVVRPWPWTINAEGAGHFFATKAEAVAATQALQGRGVALIDVGCMQIDLAYHPAAFASLDEAFDPLANALYAAHFLRLLFRETGAWTAAIAAYHSQTRTIGAAYQDKVLAVWTPPGPASLSAADSQSAGFSVPEWLSRVPEGFRRPLMLNAKLSIAERTAPAPPPAWIERIVEAASNCALAKGGPMSNPPTPAWKTAATPCVNSPFAKPATLRQFLDQP